MSAEPELVAEALPQLNEAVAELITRPEIHSLVDSLKTLLPQTSEPFVWSTLDLQSITPPLPDKIKSCIFVLKEDVSSGCHYFQLRLELVVFRVKMKPCEFGEEY